MLDNIILLPNYWVSRYKSIYSIVGPFSFFFFFHCVTPPHPTRYISRLWAAITIQEDHSKVEG